MLWSDFLEIETTRGNSRMTFFKENIMFLDIAAFLLDGLGFVAWLFMFALGVYTVWTKDWQNHWFIRWGILVVVFAPLLGIFFGGLSIMTKPEYSPFRWDDIFYVAYCWAVYGSFIIGAVLSVLIGCLTWGYNLIRA